MTILCFLQNLWVREPERWKEWLDKHEDRRAMIIRQSVINTRAFTEWPVMGWHTFARTKP